jgi:tetratricopeptide (TPR) repeat protein
MSANAARKSACATSLFTTVSLVVCLAGCARRQARAPERLAVVPFENLSSNLDLDWMRRALATALVRDLEGSPRLYAHLEESVNRAYTIHATRILEGYFYERNGRLEIRATVEDVGRRKTLQSLEAGGSLVVPLVDQLAKKLSQAAARFPSSNADAFRAYGEALSASDRSAALRELESATKDDPRFSLAYLDWAEVLFAAGDRAGALRVVETAQREQADAIDRAEVDHLSASLRGDLGGREKSLTALARLTPANDQVFRELAELQLSERRFQEAAKNYEVAARLNPDEAQTWNELGYSLAYAQDLTGARRALEHYQAMLPEGNANGLDSLGEVSFYLGDFVGAAKYFIKARDMDGGPLGAVELPKAAQARVLAGEVADGDELFRKYIGLAGGGERGGGALEVARWQFLTGRRKAAMTELERAIPAMDADRQSIGLSQLSIWKLETGEPRGAADLANQAAAHAVSPGAHSLSELCRVVSNPPAGSSGSRLADAYALLFARKYAEVAPLLELLYRATSPEGDGQIRTLLAWAYVETNRIADAGPLVRTYPLPLSSGDPVFASLIFPRFLFLRGMVLQRQGKRTEAKAAYELFLKYSGDVPDIFGDETTARRNLSTL